MNLSPSNLHAPRRIFLGVVAVLVLVVAWELSKPWRTGIREHTVGRGLLFKGIFGGSQTFPLGTNSMMWIERGIPGWGELLVDYPAMMWHFRACAKTNLHEVTPQDAYGDYYGYSFEGGKMFGQHWHTNSLAIRDGQIVLARHSTDTQTVYAIEAVEQRDRRGYFRSRKILPASGGK